MAGDEQDEKSHDPTQKRLDDARAKGQIPRSQDLLSAAALGGFVLAAMAFGPTALMQSGQLARLFLEQPVGMHPFHASVAVILPLLPLFLLPALPVLIVLIAQRGILFTVGNLRPALSRIDPFAAARRRFGSEGIADFAKGLFKLVLISAVLIFLFHDRASLILASAALAAGPVAALMLRLLIDLLILCLAVGMVIGAGDLLWQIRQHRVRHRMSRQDLVEEHKETEGDPQARATRRQRGQEIAMNRMLADVPKADVVIVNPTHYAVALQWKRGSGRAPVCLAKGTDEIALRIRALAAEHGVPIRSDPPTARALYATVELGQQIDPDLYRPVAAAIRFAESMRRKARRMP